MAAGSTYSTCNIIHNILSISNWCASAGAYYTHQFLRFAFACAQNFYLTLNGLNFPCAFLALPSAAFAVSGAAGCVRHWLLHFGENHFQHMNNSIWFYRFSFIPSAVSIWIVSAGVSQTLRVDWMEMPWKCIRLFFVYFESHRCPRYASSHRLHPKWNDTNVCDALQSIVSSQWWRRAAGAQELMDQMLRFEYFMQIN